MRSPWTRPPVSWIIGYLRKRPLGHQLNLVGGIGSGWVELEVRLRESLQAQGSKFWTDDEKCILHNLMVLRNLCCQTATDVRVVEDRPARPGDSGAELEIPQARSCTELAG